MELAKEEHGYIGVLLGVTDETAMRWAPYDGLILGGAGIAPIGAAIVLLSRRRPPW